MEYTKKHLNSFRLHMIQTKKFKSINIGVFLRTEVKKEEVTIRNFLSDILNYSTKKYKTRYDFSVAKQDLYALNTSSSCIRMGNFYTTIIHLNILNEKYTEKGMTKKSIEFFKDILFDPNVENEMFDKETFEIIKRNLKNQIESIKENPRKYSLLRMLENMGENENYSIYGNGYLEDLEKINERNLYEFYKEFMRHAIVDVFVIGDFDQNEMEKLIKENFKFETIKKENQKLIIEHDDIRSKPKVVKEKDNSTQAKLCIGCKINTLTDFERNYVLTLYNMILGETSESKLFRVVREENSLCYYISSSINKLDHLLLITSGIHEENFDKTVKLIKQEMKKIEKGDFTEEDMEKARKAYIATLDEIPDYPTQIVSSYYAMETIGIEDIEMRKKRIFEVTKEDIQKISQKINIDVIYLLGGK